MEYLFVCSQDAVESYLLSRQNRLANVQRALGELLRDWLKARGDERVGRWVLELRRARSNSKLHATGVIVTIPAPNSLPTCLRGTLAAARKQRHGSHHVGYVDAEARPVAS
jgi:hypothetical protein